MLPDCLEEQERVISILRESSGATVARINYRASLSNQFPTPCHDVLAGYDWIRENLLRDEFKRPYIARLGVCGELVGASLATMLALTETRLGESRIGAAAINNPIVDWVFPDDLPFVSPSELPEPVVADETALPADEHLGGSKVGGGDLEEVSRPARRRQKRAPKLPPKTAWQLHDDNQILPALTLTAQRDVLFRRPEDCFDSFASPIHFFRSPQAQLIFPEQENVLPPEQPDESLDMETRMHLSHYASFDGGIKEAAAVLPTLARCRSYARNYPSAGTKLAMPVWKILTGSRSPLSDQATELTKVIRRSIARHTLKSQTGRARWHDALEREKYEEFALEKVHLTMNSGIGLWTRQYDNPQWKASVEEVGSWMKQSLNPEFA